MGATKQMIETEPRWVDGLMPDQPTWVRDLVDEELVRRDTTILELKTLLEETQDYLAAYREVAPVGSLGHVGLDDLEFKVRRALRNSHV
jgi:hypothetical protein